MQNLKCVIIGGGIGGLCTAIALRQRGFEIDLYEQAPQLHEVGAGLTLWANAIKALRLLGVAEPVIVGGARQVKGAIVDWRGNRLSKSSPEAIEAQFGAPTVAIHRAKLQRILLAALPAANVHLGKRLTQITQDASQVTGQVAAQFADGSTATGDVLIGADGIQSAVRRQLFPEAKLRYAGYTAWRGVVETTEEAALQAAIGFTSESWGVGRRFGVVRISPQQVYWFATENAPPQQKFTSPAEMKTHLQALFKGWHVPVEMLIDATPAEAILHNDILDIAPSKQWSAGRVTLLGDAIHPTTPNLGQGACQAIESAVVLARCLQEQPDVAAAFRAYEAERQPRTAWITNTSWQIGKAGQISSPLLCALRNAVVKLTPESVMVANLAKAAGFAVN